MKGGAYLAFEAFRAKLPPTDLRRSASPRCTFPMRKSAVQRHERSLNARPTLKYVLVVEPARDGKLVTARKGIGALRGFHQRACRPMPAPGPRTAAAPSANSANVIQALDAMNDLQARRVSLNVGVVKGGTKPNVIAEEAYAEIDLRVWTHLGFR